LIFDKAAGDFDTIIFGRVTFEMFEGYWPKVKSGETNLEYFPQVRDEQAAERKISDLLTGMTKIVFSKKSIHTTWENTTILSGDLIEDVKSLKKKTGSGIIIFGSGTIVQQLTNEGLIDDYLLIITPVILGKGKPMFDNVKKHNLKLVDVSHYESGNVLVHYK